MNSTKITTRIGLTLSTLSLALLTACGGGGDPTGNAVTEPQQATVAAVPTVCGMQATAAQGAELFQVFNDRTMLVSGVENPISLVTSPTGYSFGGVIASLSVSMQDMREETTQGFVPEVSTNSMGVEVTSPFAPGAVGCVGGVTRATNIGTDITPNYLLSWASETLPNVPLGAIPAHAVNGFEYLNNFESNSATAVFRLAKHALADTSTVQICHVTSGGADCGTPAVTDDGVQWTFKRPTTGSGVYLLSAPLEEPI